MWYVDSVDDWWLMGRMVWVMNLCVEWFVVVVVVVFDDGCLFVIVVILDDVCGLVCSMDFDLIVLCGSNIVVLYFDVVLSDVVWLIYLDV